MNTIKEKYNKLIGLCKNCGEVCLAEGEEEIHNISALIKHLSTNSFEFYKCPICTDTCGGVIHGLLPVQWTKDDSSSSTKLENIIFRKEKDSPYQIILEWDNGIRHDVKIDFPFKKQDVMFSIDTLFHLIAKDDKI